MDDNQYARSGHIMFIVAWLLFFGLMFIFFHYYDQDKEATYQVKHGTLTINADKAGHYQIPGTINNKAVKFLIDTGATLVAIPKALAEQLQLEGRYPVNIATANGETTGSLTRIDKLTFAEFELYNVKAVIITGNKDNTVLLGMNVLSQFSMSQTKGRLVIKK